MNEKETQQSTGVVSDLNNELGLNKKGAIVYHIDGVQCMFVTETPDNWENCALTCAANE